MRGGQASVCGCFPTGRHYPGIAERIAQAVVAVEGLAPSVGADEDWRDTSLAVVDFETTGLDPAVDRILEMGVVCFEAGEIRSRRNWLIDPGVPVPEEARRVHGITDAELANAPRFESVLPEVIDLLAGRLPVAYNASFDKRFLLTEFRRAGIALDLETPPAFQESVVWIDPLVWVRELQKYEKSKKLSDVCERMNIPMDQAHRAVADAEATGKVLWALAPELPRTYGELIRIQTQYEANQEAELSTWRGRWR